MNRIKHFLAVFFAGILSGSLFAGYVGYVCPAGARQGATCEIIAGGRGLGTIKDVIVDGDPSQKHIEIESVQIVPGGLYHIQKPMQRKYVDQWIRAVFQNKPAPALPADTTGWDLKNRYLQNVDKLTSLEREMLVRGFYTRPDPLQSSPSIAQKAIIRIKVAGNAPAGLHTIRFIGSDKRPAIFNPVPFCIGDVPEVREPFRLPPPAKPGVPLVTFPAAMNGQIFPGETDHYQFDGCKGDVWSFSVRGRSLLPFIGDGVPGHFQPVLQILDQQGKEVAFQDDTYFDPDPSLNFTVPANGRYTLAIRDAIYRGRDDFVYRIEVKKGALPYRILDGPKWRLPVTTVADGTSCVRSTFPSTVTGTIQKGKVQLVKVDLKKGENVVFEIWARRSLSPLDSRLRIFDPKGKEIAMNDDFPRPKVGAVYHHADSYIRMAVPETGTYTVEIADTAKAGGKDYRYWLRIDLPRPDFRIWSVPSGIEIPSGGGVVPVGFVLERMDGHTGDVSLMLTDSGDVLLAGSRVIPFGDRRQNSFESVCGLQVAFPDCTKEYLTLKARNPWQMRMTNVKLLARSGDVIHPVIPADESMQAFAYNHLIESADCRAIATWQNSGKFLWAQDDTAVQTLKPGQEIELKVNVLEKIDADPCTAELFAPPAGFTLAGCTLKGKEITLRLKADQSMKPCRFNQVIRIDFVREQLDRKTKTSKKNKGSVYLPALMIRIAE